MSNIVVKNVKALYVMVFAPEKWEQDQVKEITKAAEGMLKGKPQLQAVVRSANETQYSCRYFKYPVYAVHEYA